MNLRSVFSVLAFSLLVIPALAVEKFGVEVYPGASEDAALTQLSQESASKMQEGLPEASRIKFEQSVFTSADSFDNVLAFYEGKFGLKAAAFNPENPAPLKPEGFALLQEIEMKDAVTSAKFFNPTLDPAKFEGKVKLVLFNKPNMPMVSVMDRGLNWKDGSMINQTILSVTKQPELPAPIAPTAEVGPATEPAAQ